MTFTPFDPFPVSSSDFPGYDILVGISQKKIQEQLNTLYETVIGDEDYVPPPGEEDEDEEREKRYLIDHDLEILLPRVSKKPNKVFTKDEKRGIRGHIKCPEIEFMSGKSRKVRLRFTFQADEKAAEGDVNSYLQYMDDDNDIVRLNINGWSFSFEADLSTSKPMDIMKEILEPARDTSKPVVVMDAAKAKFDELVQKNEELQSAGVDARVFLASSIFCLFQSTQIINSFELTRPEDLSRMTEAEAAEQALIVTTFKAAISEYFNSKAQEPNGVPTIKNPYILGYSIVQKLPTIEEVNRHANTKKTPPYFRLRRYDISVAPSPVPSDKRYGCLNFCLQTFREKVAEERDVDITVVEQQSIGVFSKPLLQNNSAGGVIGSNDGVMVISKKLFFNKYLVPTFAPTFWMNPRDLFDNDSDIKDIKPRASTDAEKLKYTKTCKWTATPTSEEGRDGFTFAAILITQKSGVSKLTVSCWSDWSKAIDENRTSSFPSDGNRDVYVQIETEATITIVHSTAGGFHVKDILAAVLGGGAASLSDFKVEERYKVVNTVRYKYVFKISAASAGVWATTLLTDQTVAPEYEDDEKTKIKHTTLEADDSETEKTAYGTMIRVTKTDPLFVDKFNDVVALLVTPMWLTALAGGPSSFMPPRVTADDTGVGEKSIKALTARVKTLSSDLQQATVMMPAGEAFTFASLDTDALGNLYSNINYATRTTGTRVDAALR